MDRDSKEQLHNFLKRYKPGQMIHIRNHQIPDVEYWTTINCIKNDSCQGLMNLTRVFLAGFIRSFTIEDLSKFEIEQNDIWIRWVND